MIDTTNILAAAQTYQKNRKGENWDKTTDSQRIFDEMIAAGLEGCHSIGAGFYGKTKDGMIFFLYIEEKSIEIYVDLSIADHIRKLDNKEKDCKEENWITIATYDFLNP